MTSSGLLHPEFWKQLRYHEQQCKLWRSKARFVAAAAGRGSGKTELARRRCVRFLNVRRPWSNPMFGYVMPTIQQGKRVAWKLIKEMVPKHWITKINESEMLIETKYGSSLYVLGADKPERIEGTQWDGIVIDESCDQRPTLFRKSVLPALSHRQGWCWRIGVPKRFGIGAVDFKEFFETGAQESYTWSSEDILTPEEIELARSQLDERDYNEQYRATWESASGAIFYCFDEVQSISDQFAYRPDLPIMVGSDFNVDPMCWVLCQYWNGMLWVFDEIFLRNANTEQTLTYLHLKYPQHVGWEFYGDASAKARKTSASMSDYLIIKSDTRFRRPSIFYPDSNPNVVDRFAATNAMLKNAQGLRRLFIHPRCKRLINDLKQRAWKAAKGDKQATREPDDHGDVGHITDAMGYVIHRKWPVTAKTHEQQPHIMIAQGA